MNICSLYFPLPIEPPALRFRKKHSSKAIEARKKRDTCRREVRFCRFLVFREQKWSRVEKSLEKWFQVVEESRERKPFPIKRKTDGFQSPHCRRRRDSDKSSLSAFSKKYSVYSRAPLRRDFRVEGGKRNRNLREKASAF